MYVLKIFVTMEEIMNNVCKVENGKLYMSKLNVVYDDIAVVLDKKGGLIKYGEYSKGLAEWYNVAIQEYSILKMQDMIDSMFLFRYKDYKDILTIDEVCVLLNYMIMVSGNGDRIVTALNSSAHDLKLEIEKLKQLGF